MDIHLTYHKKSRKIVVEDDLLVLSDFCNVAIKIHETKAGDDLQIWSYER